MKIHFFFLATILVFLSLIPRSAEMLSGNYLFGFDQGRDYLAVKDIVVGKKLTLVGSEIGAGGAGFRGIFHGPFHYYFLSIPFILNGGNPYGGMVLTFLYGITTIALGYLLGKEIFGETIWGLFVGILIAISPPLISFSRFVWNSHGAPVFILLAFYCTYILCRKDKRNIKYIFAAAFFSGFIYNFQLAIAIPMSISLLLFLALILKMRKIKEYVSLFLGFCLGFAPMILFEIRHNFMAVRGILNYLFSSPDKDFSLSALLNGHLGSFIFNFYDTFPRQNILDGKLIGIFLGLLVFYFLIKEKREDIRQFTIYLLFLPLISFIIFSFLRNDVYQYYLIHLVLAYIIIFSYIFFSAYLRKKRMLQAILTLFLIVFIVQHIPNSINTFKKDYIDYGGDAKIRGKIDAIDYIYKDAKKKKFNLLVFTPPVYTYAYDYVIWWYGKTKYNYVPLAEKKGTFYLLIEKDPSKPWSYEGWLETVIKTGDIVYTKTLPSGFIIQKRIQND